MNSTIKKTIAASLLQGLNVPVNDKLVDEVVKGESAIAIQNKLFQGKCKKYNQILRLCDRRFTPNQCKNTKCWANSKIHLLGCMLNHMAGDDCDGKAPPPSEIQILKKQNAELLESDRMLKQLYAMDSDTMSIEDLHKYGFPHKLVNRIKRLVEALRTIRNMCNQKGDAHDTLCEIQGFTDIQIQSLPAEEGKEKVCEWRYDKVNDNMITGCRKFEISRLDFVEYEMIKCPYCGKPIKEV